ncbi:hypothetical protein PLICRDRAFT_122509 [Plicaturopsis crispa FD-325 SS-3]|nr:hypothetical protein PLICRDRAFT_122509 [Plicaturopsis crispa FD-325 SS-3]
MGTNTPRHPTHTPPYSSNPYHASHDRIALTGYVIPHALSMHIICLGYWLRSNVLEARPC